MLIEFTIRNFMSYRDEVSLSMVASTTVKECESNDSYSNVSITDNGKRYLRSAAIYGANGSGKSSVIAAMDIFKSMVLRSFVDESIVKRLSLLQQNPSHRQKQFLLQQAQPGQIHVGFLDPGESIDRRTVKHTFIAQHP